MNKNMAPMRTREEIQSERLNRRDDAAQLRAKEEREKMQARFKRAHPQHK